MITRTIDQRDGIIMVASIGEATRAEIDAHYDELRRMIAAIRASGKPIRVLSDQTQATWLSDDMNRHLRSQIERTYQAGDRLAVLMPTAGKKLSARELLGAGEYGVFDSRVAAEIWLMEPSLRPPQ